LRPSAPPPSHSSGGPAPQLIYHSRRAQRRAPQARSRRPGFAHRRRAAEPAVPGTGPADRRHRAGAAN
jgi:hypothetical protein